MYEVERGKYNKKVQQVRKEKSAIYNSDLQRTWGEKQNSHKYQESDSHCMDENEFLLNYSSSESQSENSKKVNERKISSQPSLKESRKQAFKNDSRKSSSNNSEFPQSRNNRRGAYSDTRNKSRIQAIPRLCQKPDKYNKLPESTSRQNVKHEDRKSSPKIQSFKLCSETDKPNELPKSRSKQNVKQDDSNEIMYACGLDNTRAHVDNQNSRERKNNYPCGVKSGKYIPYDADHSYEGFSFYDFDLVDLLYYNVDLMQHKQLHNYAFALKEKTLEIILEFTDPVRDELEFLCAITDGSQTDKNQKLISRRMYVIIANAIEEASEKAKLSNAYGDYNERQVLGQSQNLDLTSRIDEPNRLPQHVENIKQVDLDFYESKENTFESNNSLNPFVKASKEATYVTEVNLENNSMPIVRATKFISNNAPPTCEDDIYNSFGLENLLKYNFEVMHGSSLIGYAFALRKIILENIFEFQDDIREKLEFLCELTDGSQTDVNQKLIVTRMRCLLDAS